MREDEMSDVIRDHGRAEPYDAVIVGGRVAGASTALLLARAGHRVAVVERARVTSDTLSTHLIWPAGVLLLQRWGLLEAIIAAGTPVLSRIHNDVDGVAFDLPVWPESGVDAIVAPRRTVLDPTILAAAERAGADVFERVTVDGLSRDAAGRVDGVVGRGGDGRAVHLAARVVVGADGWRSRVARDAGAVAYDERTPTNAVHYAYWAGLDHRGVEFWYRSHGLMAGVFPTNGGACIYVNCPTGRAAALRADIDRNYLRFLGEAAPDLHARLAAATRTSPVRGTVGLPGFLRRPHGPGWALVGDAGWTKDPASAHGITAALRDAELAAAAIDAGLRGAAAVDDALQAFHTTRDRSRSLYRLGWEMASYDWDGPRLLDLEAQFVAEVIREARETAALPAWPGSPGSARPAVA
jgi:flavin-dependent dehydrogenase